MSDSPWAPIPSGSCVFVVGEEIQTMQEHDSSGSMTLAVDNLMLLELPMPSETQKTFVVANNVLMDISYVVAMAGKCNGTRQEVLLPQFRPHDFELFLRLVRLSIVVAPTLEHRTLYANSCAN